MDDLEKQFKQASENSKKLKARPDDDTLLELYSYYKQATEGDVTGDKPGPFDFRARAKYEAWAGRKGMGREVAMKGYVKLIKHLQDQD